MSASGPRLAAGPAGQGDRPQPGGPRAFANALTTFSEFPLVEIPIEHVALATERLDLARRTRRSKPKSFATAVSSEVSVVSAIAAIASRRRSSVSVLTNSVARCCASPALPPLPQSRILPPPRRDSTIAAVAPRICSPHSSAVRAAVREVSSRVLAYPVQVHGSTPVSRSSRMTRGGLAEVGRRRGRRPRPPLVRAPPRRGRCGRGSSGAHRPPQAEVGAVIADDPGPGRVEARARRPRARPSASRACGTRSPRRAGADRTRSRPASRRRRRAAPTRRAWIPSSSSTLSIPRPIGDWFVRTTRPRPRSSSSRRASAAPGISRSSSGRSTYPTSSSIVPSRSSRTNRRLTRVSTRARRRAPRRRGAGTRTPRTGRRAPRAPSGPRAGVRAGTRAAGSRRPRAAQILPPEAPASAATASRRSIGVPSETCGFISFLLSNASWSIGPSRSRFPASISRRISNAIAWSCFIPTIVSSRPSSYIRICVAIRPRSVRTWPV